MIYLLIFAFSSVFFYLSSLPFNKRIKPLPVLLTLIAIALPSLLAGFRDLSIGTDTVGYVYDTFDSMKYHENISVLLAGKYGEPLYSLLAYFSYKLSPDIHLFLFFSELLPILFVYWGAKQFRKVPLWFIMSLYYLSFYCMGLNMARQIIAMSICFCSFAYFLNGSYKRSFIIFILAIGFHSTAFLYVVVPILYWFFYLLRNRKNFFLYKVSFCLLSFAVVFSLQFLMNIFISLGLLGDRFNTYANSDIFGSSIPLSDLFFVIMNFVFFEFIIRRKRTSFQYQFYDTLFLIEIILCFSGLISTFAVRGSYYYSFLSILIIPLSLFKNLKINNISVILICCFYLFYWFASVVYADLSQVYPYTSSILGI